MPGQRWGQLEHLFSELITLPPDRRAARLREACGGDDDLRAELDSLLSAHEGEGPLDAPAVALDLLSAGLDETGGGSGAALLGAEDPAFRSLPPPPRRSEAAFAPTPLASFHTTGTMMLALPRFRPLLIQGMLIQGRAWNVEEGSEATWARSCFSCSA